MYFCHHNSSGRIAGPDDCYLGHDNRHHALCLLYHEAPSIVHGMRSFGSLSVSLINAGLLPQAKEHGFGMVGTSNTSTSTGSIGYYARAIADAGLIAFCFAQSPEVQYSTRRDYRYRARRRRVCQPENDASSSTLSCSGSCRDVCPCCAVAVVDLCVDCVVPSSPPDIGLDTSQRRPRRFPTDTRALHKVGVALAGLLG